MSGDKQSWNILEEFPNQNKLHTAIEYLSFRSNQLAVLWINVVSKAQVKFHQELTAMVSIMTCLDRVFTENKNIID